MKIRKKQNWLPFGRTTRLPRGRGPRFGAGFFFARDDCQRPKHDVSYLVTLNLFQGPWPSRFLRRCAGLEVRPWMLKQVQHDETIRQLPDRKSTRLNSSH